MMRLVALYFILLFSCSTTINKSTNPLPQEIIPFETLAQDFYGGMADSNHLVIKDTESLVNIYELINKGRIPALDIPTINFNKETVIALFLGEKNSGGYSIAVEKIMSINGKVTVTYKITTPKPGNMVSSVMTQPFCIVKMPKSSNEIVFDKI
jgi:lysyl-tRNA synthetase class I